MMNPCKRLVATLFSVLFLACATAQADHHESKAQKQATRFLAMRQWDMDSAEQQQQLLDVMESAVVPALNRAGVKPVGVFKPRDKDDKNPKAIHSVYVILPFDSLDDWLSFGEKLGQDSEFLSAAGKYLNATKENPAFNRSHVTLLQAFDGFPFFATAPQDDLFELRIYESHSEIKGMLKVAMFNEGEIEIFQNVGMRPVFFGEALAGQNLPKLVYMLSYKDQAERDKVWKAFLADDDWKVMSKDPRYADTVSGIEQIMLLRAKGSQL